MNLCVTCNTQFNFFVKKFVKFKTNPKKFDYIKTQRTFNDHKIK